MSCRPSFFVQLHLIRRIAAVAGGLLALTLSACDIGSADSTTRSVSDTSGTRYDFSGLYVPYGSDAQFLVHPPRRQSGAALTWLRLLQHGNVLEAYDSAGQTWSGQISSVQGGSASFTFRGRTSAGVPVDVAGALRYSVSGDVPTSTMDATWIEPSFSGSILARATVSPPATESSNDGEENGDGDDNGDNGGDNGDNDNGDDDGDNDNGDESEDDGDENDNGDEDEDENGGTDPTPPPIPG